MDGNGLCPAAAFRIAASAATMSGKDGLRVEEVKEGAHGEGCKTAHAHRAVIWVGTLKRHERLPVSCPSNHRVNTSTQHPSPTLALTTLSCAIMAATRHCGHNCWASSSPDVNIRVPTALCELCIVAWRLQREARPLAQLCNLLRQHRRLDALERMLCSVQLPQRDAKRIPAE